MQAVGELEDEDTDIALDRFENMLEVVDLGLVRLGNCPDEEGNVRSEAFPDLLDRVICILHNIMQEGRGDDGYIPLTHLPCHDERHGQRMQNIRLPALASLPLMGLPRQLVRILHQRPLLSTEILR